ncbi:MAG: hypothetical protein IKY13_07580 [Bacteroidaceae bacterium]|nr:hypothetical protein [Bacteroidaceae bacterium]
MKKSFLMMLPLGALMFASCNHGISAEEQALQQANDSLRQANAEIRNYYEEMIGYITEIDADMQAIKSAENFVIEQSADTGDITMSAQSRIKKDIELMANTLQRNRERIAELEKRLQSSNANSAALRKSIEQLKEQIAEKDALIVELQASLAARDVRIGELDETVSNLSSQVTDLTNVTQNQASVIASQDMALNEVYYIYAYTEQLRENNILTGGGLFSKTQVLKESFNRDAFVKADMRTLNSIFLESKKVKVCTNHPADSYELVQDEEGFYTLNILNPDNFWSLSRFLVVELK